MDEFTGGANEDRMYFCPNVTVAEIAHLRPLQARLLAACATNDRLTFSAVARDGRRFVVLSAGDGRAEIPTPFVYNDEEALVALVAKSFAEGPAV